MSKKSPQIAERIAPYHGQELDPHYLGYFDCFNRQLFYEAHDVLEELWLVDRQGENGDFFKGLIQLAGAFVHVQKNRRGPAMALLRLARANLAKYAPCHQKLDLPIVQELIQRWMAKLEAWDAEPSRLLCDELPRLQAG